MMNFVLQTPSLQHVAEVKIVAQMWNQPVICKQIAQSFDPSGSSRSIYVQLGTLKKVEEKVRSKVSALPLPEPFKERLLILTKSIGDEVINWCGYYIGEHYNCQFLDYLLLNPVCWTMHGTVDYGKTAEVMVKNERVDVITRYEFACINCLEEEARKLFCSMSEVQRQKFIAKVSRVPRAECNHLIVYFTCTFNGDAGRLDDYFQPILKHGESIKKCLFRVMLDIGNRATFEYLFSQLNPDEKERVLIEPECQAGMLSYIRIHIRSHSPANNLVYYFFLMNEEQRELMFRKYTQEVLICLLKWPWQPLFAKAAKRGWQLMDRDGCSVLGCSKVLSVIIDKIYWGFRDYDYCQLFMECWSLNSAGFKRDFLSHVYHLCCLVQTEKEEIVKLVLNEGPADQLLAIFDGNYFVKRVLLDEGVVSEAALRECKEKAVMDSSNDKEDVGKRLRSQLISQLVDIVMENRNKS